MSEETKFSGWAVVSLFGHQKEAGYVETVYFGGPAMFRIDVPELPEREWVLERPQRGDNYELLPIGTKVKREAVPARSPLVGVNAIYRMDPCTEEVARHAIEVGIPRPLIVLEMPKQKQLSAGEPEEAHAETVLPGEEDYENDDDSGIDTCPHCGAPEDEECREGCPNA